METIGNWFMFLLVNSIWQITTVVLLSLLCDRLLRNMAARVRHILWVLALILAVALPVFSGIDFKSVSDTGNEALSPTDLQNFTFDTASPPVLSSDPQKPGTIPMSETLVLGLFTSYLLLISIRLFKLVNAFRQMLVIRRSAFPGRWSESHATIIDDCKRACGVTTVEVLCSAIVQSPITLGALRPRIILPEALLGETDQNILISAVSHELDHVRRHDYLLNLLYELICLPISFHPAATLVKRRIKETRELICDEHVTDTIVEPVVYARSLVSIAGLAMDLGRGSNITIGILDDGALEKRVMQILNRSNVNSFRKGLLLASATLVFALAIIATLSFALTPVVAQKTDNADIEAKKKAEREAMLLKETLEKVVAEGKTNRSDEAKDPTLEELAVRMQLENRRAELEASLLNSVDLTKPVNITMAQAINIAVGEVPGTVLESTLVFEKNGGETEDPFYVIKIAVNQDGRKTSKRIIVSGIDGSIGGPHNN